MKRTTLFISLILIMVVSILPQISFAATGNQNDPHIVNTVEELTTAFANGGYIKLNTDIDVGGFTGNKFVVASNANVILDLNGYTLSGENNDEKVSTALICNKGTLVINDNSSEKDGRITMDDTGVRCYTWGHGMFAINNYGMLTINNGTIENIGSTDVPYAIDNNTTVANAILTINGGTITANVCAIRAYANSTAYSNDIIVKGGKITAGTSAIWMQQPSDGKAGKASLLVEGGKITAEKSYAIYADVNNSDAADTFSMTITGGVIENNSETSATVAFVPRSGSSLDSAPLNLSISGGTINNNNPAGSAVMDAEYTTIITDGINITGGKFSSDISKYLDTASGISTFTDDNGMINVGVPRDIEITNNSNGKIEASLSEAIQGQKVQLTISPEQGYELSKLIVLDDNNNEIEVIDGKFSMPATKVTIKAEFKRIEYSIIIGNIVNGSVTSNLKEAAEGQSIELTVTPDAGYEVGEIVVTDANGTKIEIANNSFVMPDSKVEVNVVFNELKQEVQVPDAVVNEDKVKDIVLESLKVNEKFEEALKNNNIEVEVEVTEGEDKVDNSKKQEIEKALGDNVNIAKYMDITILVKNKNNGTTIDTLDELTEKIKFTVAIPEDVLKSEVAEGFARKYYIIRNHNGVIEYLDAILSEDGKNISFETDKFSAYALAYRDEEITTSEGGIGESIEEPKDDNLATEETNTNNIPNTGDNIVLYVLLTIVSVAGIILAKKVNTKKSKH